MVSLAGFGRYRLRSIIRALAPIPGVALGLSILEAQVYGDRRSETESYPLGFLDFAYEKLGVPPDQIDFVVHLCSGHIERGLTVDIRPETDALLIRDARDTGIKESSVPWVLIDPPPYDLYQQIVYGIPGKAPTAEELLKEAERILKPKGRCAVLSMILPEHPKGLSPLGIWALILPNPLVIRGFFLYEKL